MTDPAIITVDKDAVRGIITLGKPAGLYMAMSNVFPRIWTGVDSRPGHLCLMKHGTFPEVLDWLMYRGGIMKRGEPVEIRNASREREWRGARTREAMADRTASLPLRIEGAEVQEWRELPGEVMGFDGTPVAGIDAEMLRRSRKRGGVSSAPAIAERDEKIIRMYEAGETYDAIAQEVGIATCTVYERIKYLKRTGRYNPAPRRDKKAIEARDAEILKLAFAGMTWVQIAEQLGVTAKAVSHRINSMRMKGYYIPNKARLESQERNRERDERVIRLVKDGLALSAIARETGEQKRAVSRRLQRLREEGRI